MSKAFRFLWFSGAKTLPGNHKLNYTLKRIILEQTKYLLSCHANLRSLLPSLLQYHYLHSRLWKTCL